MMLKLHDFQCSQCNYKWEDLVDDDISTCQKCNTETTRLKVCSGQLGRFSIKNPDERREELMKRSADHTLKELRKNPEKFGPEGVRRAREGQIKSFGGI